MNMSQRMSMNRPFLASCLLLGTACGNGTAGTDMIGPLPDMADAGPGGPHFTVDTVDSDATGAGVALVFDAAGKPQMFYLGVGADMNCNLGGNSSKYHPATLFHAVPGGSGYTRLTVNGTALVEPNGIGAALDPKTGRPAVVFQGGKPGANFCGGSDAMLGRFDGAAWGLTTVADVSTATSGVVDRPGAVAGAVDKSGDVVGAWSALAIGASGAVYVAWQDVHFGFADNDFSKADLEFASAKGGSFVLGDEVDNAGAGLYNSMALDPAERPVLAYSGYGTGGVNVAVRTGDKKWTFSRLQGGGSVAPSVAVAPKSGMIGVAFYDTTLKVLRLAESRDSGGTWKTQVVDHDGDVGRAASLSYDANDHAVVGYYKCGPYNGGQGCDPMSDAVRVARRDDTGTWIATNVDDGGVAACGAYVSLALDGAGKAGILYQCFVFDHQLGDFKATVKYAKED